MSAAELSRHVTRLGIPLVALNAAERDMDTLEEWLASS